MLEYIFALLLLSVKKPQELENRRSFTFVSVHKVSRNFVTFDKPTSNFKLMSLSTFLCFLFEQILQVSAIDLDTGNNARLTYRLENAANNNQQKQQQHKLHSNVSKELFGIFPNSGWIYLRGTLDRETRDRYDLTVLASDNGTPSATATTSVIISVMDSNDNDPNFLLTSYEFSVEENLRRGAVVGTIQAKDADLDINAAIRYSLIPSNSSFQINPISGE